MFLVKAEVTHTSQADSDQWLKEWSDGTESFKAEVNVKPEDLMSNGDVKEDKKCLEIEGRAEYSLSVKRDLPQKCKKSSKVPNNDANWKHKTHLISQEADMLLKDLCLNAPVSDTFSDKCFYKCLECNDTFTSWKRLRRHSLRNHSIAISYAQVGKLIVKAESYVCKICSARLLCDNTFLYRHLTRHKMTVGQYARKFVASREQPEGVSYEYSEKVIGNLCSYKCKGCSLEFKCQKSLLKHQDRFFMCKQTETTSNMILIVYHHCKLCKRKIVCSATNLKRHFRGCHNLSLEEYCSKTGCTIDKNSNKSRIPVHDHENLENAANDSEKMLLRSSLESNNRRVVYVTNKIIANLCKNAPVSKGTFNGCMFQCQKCLEQFKDWESLRRHTKKVHHVNNLSVIDVQKFISKTTCYICKICSAKLLCDSTFITRHLINFHDMRLGQYGSKYEPMFYSTSLETTYSEKVIGNLCLYECEECKQLFDNPTSFNHHRSKYLHASKTFTQSLAKRVCHKCKLCNKSVICSKVALKCHFQSCHKLSIKEYHFKTGCTIT